MLVINCSWVFFFSTCFYQLPECKALGIIGFIIFTLALPEMCPDKVSPVGYGRQYTDESSAKGMAGRY